MAPNTIPAAPVESLTPERLQEIKDLLRYESSIAFYSSRAKESMLLMVAEIERLWAERQTQATLAPPRRPVDPNSRAARLARILANKHADAKTVVIDAETLTVDVTPMTLGEWDWWQQRFRIPTGETTFRGSYATAKGMFGRVKVLLTGHGVPALYAAERDGGAA